MTIANWGDDMTTEKLTEKEQGILAIVRYNAENPPKEIKRRAVVLGWEFTYTRRSSKSLWGRFGGGWQWKFGVQWGTTTMIVDLLVASVRICRAKVSA